MKIWKLKKPTTDVEHDCMGSPLPFKPAAWVFFLDPTPEANWAHECSYLAVPVSGEDPEAVTREWPPRDMDRWEEI